MQVGFTVTTRSGGVECRLFGGPLSAEPLLTTHQTADHAAVLLGRLYYREELRDHLGLPRPGKEDPVPDTDAALALETYRRFGPQGLERLEGDFALVVWDGRANHLVGLRDPLGGYPLFWVQQGGVFALSTGLTPLLGLLPSANLDLAYLGDFLTLPGCWVAEVHTERCAFQGVRRVLPGSLVSLDLGNGCVQQRACWNWLDRLEDPGTDRFEEVAAGLAGRLRSAVGQRLRGTTAAHLSGGMDSTAVALLARAATAPGGPAPLHALSLVYERLPGLARETAYIESALKGQAGIVGHRIAADDLLQFDGFTDPPPHDEPWPSLQSLASNRALVETAARAGAVTVLTGLGADETLDVPPYHIAELLRRRRLRAAWAEAGRWARADHLGLWQVLYPYGVAPLLPAWAQAGVGALLHGGYVPWSRQRSYTIPPWVRPDFARRHNLPGLALDHVRRTYQACWPVGLATALAAVAARAGDTTRWHLAAPRGLHTAHPFLDTRVLRYALGVRARMVPVPGHLKPLLAEAMRGVLPEAIRTRPGKGNFNEVHALGLSRNLPALEELVLRSPTQNLDWLDRDVLLDCLRQAALGVGGDAGGMDRLGLTLSLLVWLATPGPGCCEASPCQVLRWQQPGGRFSPFNAPEPELRETVRRGSR